MEQKIERGDLIVVTWFDIEDDPTWKPVELAEVEKVVLCKTVGWLINMDDDCLRLAFSVNGTEETKLEVGREIIPRAVIKNIEKVRDDELGVN